MTILLVISAALFATIGAYIDKHIVTLNDEYCDLISSEIYDINNTYSLKNIINDLEESIKNKMIELDTPKCGNYTLSKTTKSKFNEKRFAEEQSDIYESYLEESTSYTLRKGKGE